MTEVHTILHYPCPSSLKSLRQRKIGVKDTGIQKIKNKKDSILALLMSLSIVEKVDLKREVKVIILKEEEKQDAPKLSNG